jgi:hypothetical protein
MPHQSNRTCITGPQWISDDCAAHALCVPALAGSDNQGICQCDMEPNLYVENDHNSCDPSHATWAYAAIILIFVFMASHIAVRMTRLFRQARKQDMLKLDTLGITTILLLFTSYFLIVLLVARIAVTLINSKHILITAMYLLGVCQAIYALFSTSTIIFLGVSFIVVIHQSAKLSTGSEKFQRNLLIVASANGILIAACTIGLTVTRRKSEFGIAVICNALTMWLLYYLLQLRLRRHFPASSTLSNILDIISASANRLLFGLIAVMVSTAGGVLSYHIGQKRRSRAILGPVSTAWIIAIYLGCVLVNHAMVRCIEKLVRNRQSLTNADSSGIGNVDASYIETSKLQQRQSDSPSTTPIIAVKASATLKPQSTAKPHVIIPKHNLSMSTQNDIESVDREIV